MKNISADVRAVTVSVERKEKLELHPDMHPAPKSEAHSTHGVDTQGHGVDTEGLGQSYCSTPSAAG